MPIKLEEKSTATLPANPESLLSKLTRHILHGGDANGVRNLLRAIEPPERLDLLRAHLPATAIKALCPPSQSSSQRLFTESLEKSPEPCTPACLAAALGHRDALCALLNADPASLEVKGPILWAASQGQLATLGVLAGVSSRVGRPPEPFAVVDALKQTLAELDPKAAAWLIAQWLGNPGDADWTALLAVTLTDFVAGDIEKRDAFADFVGRLVVIPEFVPALAHLRGKPAICQELVAHGAVGILVRAVVNAQDPQIRCACLKTLATLAAAGGEVEQAFVGSDAPYQQLLACLDAGNEPSMRETAARALHALAVHTEEKARIGRLPGAVATLQGALVGDQRVAYLVLACMANLAVDDDNKTRLGTDSILRAAVSWVSAGDNDTSRAAAALLRNLAILPANSMGIVERGGIEALSSRAAALPLQPRLAHISALGNLAIEQSHAAKIAQFPNVIAMLTHFLGAADLALATHAARVLQNVSLCVPGKRAIVKAGGIVPAVRATMQQTNPSLCYQALAMLANVAVLDDEKNSIIEAFAARRLGSRSWGGGVLQLFLPQTNAPTPPGIQRLLQLVDDANDLEPNGPKNDLAACALALIRNVSVDKDVRTFLHTHGFVEAAVAKLTHRNEHISELAMAVLGILASDPTIRRGIDDAVLHKVIDLLGSRSARLVTTAKLTLRVFATDRVGLLRNMGVLQQVIDFVP